MDGKIENHMETGLTQQPMPLRGACFEVLSEDIEFRD